MKFHFMSSEAGDWIGLYINGELVEEGHSISEIKVTKRVVETVMKTVPGFFAEVSWEERDFERLGWGRCPFTLAEANQDSPLPFDN